jgi:predicted RNA-binding protein with TRAM domain
MRNDRGGRRDFGSSNFAPVKVGDEIDVKIEAVGEKGDGIAKKDGFVLFVAGTKQGEDVRIRVTKVLQKVGFAEVVGAAQSAPAESTSTQKRQHHEGPVEEHSPEPAAEDSEDFGEEDNS